MLAVFGQPPFARRAATVRFLKRSSGARQASKAATATCRNLSLCVYYNILHFFLPLPKQQATRHLGYFQFDPPPSLPPPPAAPLYLSTSTFPFPNRHSGYFKRKWIHVLGFFPPLSLPPHTLQVFPQSFKTRWKKKSEELNLICGFKRGIAKVV